jgi:hypothetical protein
MLLALVAAIASPLAAQDPWKPDTQVGDFEFNIPSGWARRDSRDGPTLVPNDVGRGSVAYIGFLAAAPVGSDLRSWFDARWREWQRQFRVVDAGATPSADRTSQGLERLRIYTRISSSALGFCAFVFGAVRVGDRVESYYFVSNANRWSYLNDLEALEHSLQFANVPGAEHQSRAVTQAGTAGGLDGLYIGYRMRGATPYESTHFEYLVFFPDGNVIRTLPWEGLEHFDFAATVKSSREYCGRYTVSGGRVTMHWGDNSIETAARATDHLEISGDSYFPVSSADGLTLNGVYRREGQDLARYGIRFTPDGRFAENGMLPLVAYSLTSEKNISQAPGAGTYRIGKNTLTLSYADGRRIALSFFVWPAESGSMPTAIHVDTYRLVRGK